MKATYLLIKSSVLSVTDLDEPKVPDYGDCEMDASDSEITGEQLYKRRMDGYTIAMDVFLESFIKVDNPQMLWDMQNDDGYYLYDKEGLFPAPEGIEFEVKWHNPCIGAKKCLIADDQNRNNCAQLHGNKCQKEYRVAVLTPLKQSGEPGNEAKKGEGNDIQKSKLINYELLLHQITSIVDHFEPSPSNPVYNQWYLLKKHTYDFKKIAGYLTNPLK